MNDPLIDKRLTALEVKVRRLSSESNLPWLVLTILATIAAMFWYDVLFYDRGWCIRHEGGVVQCIPVETRTPEAK